MVEEPAIPAVRRNVITVHPRLFSYLCSLSSNDPLFALVSSHSFFIRESLFADHDGCVLVPGQLTLSRQRKAIISLAFGRSAVLDLLLYFVCFVTLAALLLPPSVPRCRFCRGFLFLGVVTA